MNELIYLKFRYQNEATTSSNSNDSKLQKVIINFLEKIIPKANPDFDELINQVSYWKIEYNVEKHWTNREMGFDKSNKLILAMPLGDNYGFWSDIQMELEDFKRFNTIEIESSEFIKEWDEFEYKFNVSHHKE